MEHYYSEKQETEFLPNKIIIRLKNDQFELYSASGVFSKGQLDKASKLLIENAKVPKKGSLLDIGCGYGVIGISILRKNTQLSVTFSDINERALKLAKMNLNSLGLKGKIIKSDLFKNIKDKFDCILVNPPMAAGRKLCFKLIEDSFNHLKDGGELQLVARHKKGGEQLQKQMQNVFGNTDVLAKGAGFRIYLSEKKR